ncbi:MAG: hypothetical protein WBM62_20120 [Crocosphaera sp.]
MFINHSIQQNFTTEVWQLFIINLPMILIGLVAGFLLSKVIDLLLFRKLVLILLIMAGLQLLIKVILTY